MVGDEAGSAVALRVAVLVADLVAEAVVEVLSGFSKRMCGMNPVGTENSVSLVSVDEVDSSSSIVVEETTTFFFIVVVVVVVVGGLLEVVVGFSVVVGLAVVVGSLVFVGSGSSCLPTGKMTTLAFPPLGTVTTQKLAPPAPAAELALLTLPTPSEEGSIEQGVPMQLPVAHSILTPKVGGVFACHDSRKIGFQLIMEKVVPSALVFAPAT